MSQKVNIVMYHYVRDLKNSRYPDIKGLDYELFKNQIKFFKENYNFVRMEDVIDAANNNGALPDKAVLLTFDDGYADHFTNVFPLLVNEGIQGSFFISGKTFTENKLLDVNKIHFILASTSINTLLPMLYEELDHYRGKEFTYPSNKELFEQYAVATRLDIKEVIFAKRILQNAIPFELRTIISSNLFNRFVGINEEKFAKELYVQKEQIKCMKKSGMHIGVHGYDHFWLGKLEQEQLEDDLTKALEVMDEFIDNKSWTMNYPYGNYSENVVELVKSKGCRLGLATEVRQADISKDSKFILPRFDTNDFPPVSENYKNF